jgi:hypothetical protein
MLSNWRSNLVPNGSYHADQCITLSMVVADAVDGAVRLLNDVQRFGFRIRALRVDGLEGQSASICVTIAIPPKTDASQIRSRLARHPTVLLLETV